MSLTQFNPPTPFITDTYGLGSGHAAGEGNIAGDGIGYGNCHNGTIDIYSNFTRNDGNLHGTGNGDGTGDAACYGAGTNDYFIHFQGTTGLSSDYHTVDCSKL